MMRKLLTITTVKDIKDIGCTLFSIIDHMNLLIKSETIAFSRKFMHSLHTSRFLIMYTKAKSTYQPLRA